MKIMNVIDLPKERWAKAREIVQSITANPKSYLDYGGRRLTSDRSVVSVPLGGNQFRVLFVENASRMFFCGAVTHGDYDNLIGNGTAGRRLRVIEPVFAPTFGDALPELAKMVKVVEVEMEKSEPKQQELPMTEPPKKKRIQRKVRAGNLRKVLAAHLDSIPPGQTFNVVDLAKATGGSNTGCMLILKPRIEAGEFEYYGVEGRHQRFRKVVKAEGAKPTKDEIVNRLLEGVAALSDYVPEPVPMAASIKSFTDDELIAEINARMRLRVAA